MQSYRYIVIGGGIVGLATALSLLTRDPGASLLLLDKEARLAAHQTGHNSGVIHSGIYYAPGSMKARLCAEGSEATKQFCDAHGVPYEVRGKLLVATNALELERLAALEKRSVDNGVVVEALDARQLQRLEPNISGSGALRVPTSAIVDYRQVCEAMAGRVAELGGTIALNQNVTAIDDSGARVEIRTGDAHFAAERLVVCGGIQADRLARLANLDCPIRHIPFKGEYFRLPASMSGVTRHMIYPVPDPALPFLGIHLTPMIDGSVTVGPNAVLSLAREDYRRFAIDGRDAVDTLFYSGFWRVVARYWRATLEEAAGSLSKRRYLKACQKYCPSLRLEHLGPYPPGIRAQAVDPDGTLVHDFMFAQSDRMLHVLNAPSPAATAALPIANVIVDKLGVRAK